MTHKTFSPFWIKASRFNGLRISVIFWISRSSHEPINHAITHHLELLRSRLLRAGGQLPRRIHMGVSLWKDLAATIKQRRRLCVKLQIKDDFDWIDDYYFLCSLRRWNDLRHLEPEKRPIELRLCAWFQSRNYQWHAGDKEMREMRVGSR